VEFDWTTFVLEIVNFLILVWLLKHFFYAPVKGAIRRRREGVEQELGKARELHEQAQTLKQEYADHLKAWQDEQRQAREALAARLAEQGEKEKAALAEELQRIRTRSEALDERRSQERRRVMQHEALQRAQAFLRRLLGELRGPELQQRLIDMLVKTLPGKDDETGAEFRRLWRDSGTPAAITTAYPLAPEQRRGLIKQLQAVLGERGPEPEFDEDEGLLAGIRFRLGDRVVSASLADELERFVEAGRDD